MPQRKCFWVVATPIDTATSTATTVRLCSANVREATGLVTGQQFLPYIESFPERSYSIFDGEFNGGSDVTIDKMEISANNSFGQSAFNYVWDGCSVQVYIGDASAVTVGGGLGIVTKIFDGAVKGSPEIQEDILSINLVDKSYLLLNNVLDLEYGGSGEYDGPIGYKGVMRPMVIGSVTGIVPILLNAPYLLFEYHAYGRTGGVQGLFENGLAFGAATTTVAWAGSVAATYAALKAVTLTLGQWADAPSIGCFRLGGEPKDGGVITCDVIGQLKADNVTPYARADDILTWMVARSPIGSGVDASNLTAYYTLIGSLNLGDYFDQQATIDETIRRWLAGSGSYYFFGSDGLFAVGSIRQAVSPDVTFDLTARSNQVEYLNSLPMSAPYEIIRIGGQKCFRVHENSEISDALITFINQSTDPNYWTINEKASKLIPEEADVEATYQALLTRGTALGITTELTAATSARSTWLSYRNAQSPAWNDKTAPTAITRTTAESNRSAYTAALVTLNKKVSEIDATLAVWNTITGTGKPSDYATTDILLTETGSSVLTIVGNSLKQTTGTGYYCAVGQRMSGPCFAEVDIDTSSGSWTMVNLDRDATGASYVLQDIAVHYQQSAGTLNVYVGAGTASYGITIASLTGKLRVAYDGDRFRVFVGGIEQFVDLNAYPYLGICVGDWDASGIGPNYYPKWQAYTSGVTYTGLRIGAFADNSRKLAFPLTAVGSSPPSIHGDMVISRTSATYQSAVRGIAFAGSIYAEVDINNTGSNYTMIGLDQSASGVIYSAAEDLFVQYQSSTGILFINRKGVNIINPTLATGIVGKIGVGYDGVRYRVWINGVEYALSSTYPGMFATGPGLTHYPKWCPYSAVSILTGINAYPFTESDYDSIGGKTAPEKGGTAGQNVAANGNAEAGDLRGWRADTNFMNVGSTFMISTAQKQSGQYSFLLHKTASGNAAAAVNRAFAAKPGDRFLVRIWAHASAAGASGFYGYMLGKTSAPSDGFVDTLSYTTSPYMAEGYAGGNIALASGVNTFDWDWTVPAGWTGCQFVSFEIISNPNVAVDLHYEVQIFPQAPGTQLVDQITGRILDGKTLNPSNNFGLRSLASFPVITDTYVSSSTVTLNIPSSTFYGDWGGTVTYPSGSITGAAFATKYYVWRNVGGDPASTGTSYGSSTVLTDALGYGKVYLGYFTTRSSGPTPPPPPPPPPGGGNNCVDADSWVWMADGTVKMARDVESGDQIIALNMQTRQDQCIVTVQRCSLAEEECVHIVGESGAELILSKYTPMELIDDRRCLAKDVLGEFIPMCGFDCKLVYDRIVSVTPVGDRIVARISAHSATFAAGMKKNRALFSHNVDKP